MSKSKTTGKHSQSKNRKISFNMRPIVEDEFLKIKEVFKVWNNGYPVSNTFIFEVMILEAGDNIDKYLDSAMK